MKTPISLPINSYSLTLKGPHVRCSTLWSTGQARISSSKAPLVTSESTRWVTGCWLRFLSNLCVAAVTEHETFLFRLALNASRILMDAIVDPSEAVVCFPPPVEFQGGQLYFSPLSLSRMSIVPRVEKYFAIMHESSTFRNQIFMCNFFHRGKTILMPHIGNRASPPRSRAFGPRV